MKTQLEAEVEKQKIALDNSIDTVRLVLQPVRRFMAGRHIKYLCLKTKDLHFFGNAPTRT